jgi:hypothetical protein
LINLANCQAKKSLDNGERLQAMRAEMTVSLAFS